MKKLAKIFRKGFLTIFLVIAACFCFSSPSLAFGPSNDIILNGIDISDWQGDIDFNAVKESGIDIVYIKAGQGGYEDQLVESNYNKAKAAGLNIGFYYYLTATNTEQAKPRLIILPKFYREKTLIACRRWILRALAA